MRDEAARALRAYEHDLADSEQRRPPLRSVDSPAYEPPHRREAPPRAYGNPDRSDLGPRFAQAAGGVAGRRTIEIRGQVAAPRRRSSPSATAFAAHPDRAALWAVFLALFLVLMAVATH
jgi:hypothetical protein